MTERVLVSMPYCGKIEFGSAQGLFCPSNVPGRVYRCCGSMNSSLPSAFNNALCTALNFRDENKITHFAMIHSDIAPEGPWLDVLWHLLKTHKLGMLAATAAIKENVHDPRTSTAVANVKNRWNVKRCLRRSETLVLPEVFTGSDVCGPGEILVCNTGLWLTDLRFPAWDEFPGFQQHHTMGRDPVTKQWGGLQRTEDWELSYHLHEHGVPYGATTAITVAHHGDGVWLNR